MCPLLYYCIQLCACLYVCVCGGGGAVRIIHIGPRPRHINIIGLIVFLNSRWQLSIVCDKELDEPA